MRIALTAVVLMLVGCDAASPPPSPSQPPLTVFLAVDDARIEAMLDEFGTATGTPIVVRRGAPAELADALIGKVGDPADLLITDSVADTWRAADRGALRPISSAALGQHHASLRDPDSLWYVLEIRPHAIVHTGRAQPSRVSYEDLGTAEFSGRLCVSSSSLPSNRALLANLIESKGALETERLVRRWVRNLAQAPYPTAEELRSAVQAGDCEFGIAGNPHTVFGDWSLSPVPHSFEATAVGVGRHAPHPEAAQALADWLLVNKSIRVPAFAELPRAGVAGWRDEEALLLAERAGYR